MVGLTLPSPHTAQDYQIRCHDREEAGEVVKALNERITVKDGVMLRGRTRRRHNRREFDPYLNPPSF